MDLEEAREAYLARNKILEKQVFITKGYIVINVTYE